MRILFILLFVIFRAPFIMGQNNNQVKDEKLEKLFLAEREETINNMKWYGSLENWKDIRFISEYFDIDLKKEEVPFKHKFPVFMAEDFGDLTKNFVLNKIENTSPNREIQFGNDTQTQHAFCEEGDNNSIRYFFEQISDKDSADNVRFYMTIHYCYTNTSAIRTIFHQLTYMNSMGADQMLRFKRIAKIDKYQFGDICFVLPSPEIEKNEKRLTFYFVRNGVAFQIERPYDTDIDVVEFAQYVDDKFVEISKALNPELEDYQLKPSIEPKDMDFLFQHEMTLKESEEYIRQQKILVNQYHRASEKSVFPTRVVGLIDDEPIQRIFINPPFTITKNSFEGYVLRDDFTMKSSDQWGPACNFDVFIDTETWQDKIQPNLPYSDTWINVTLVCCDSGDVAASTIFFPLPSSNPSIPGTRLFRLRETVGDKCLFGVGTKERLPYNFWDEKNIGHLFISDHTMYFTRGNIAVKLQSRCINFGCIDLARKIDAFLIEEAKRQAEENVKQPESVESE